MTHFPATDDLKDADLMTLVKLIDALYELTIKPKPRTRDCNFCGRTFQVWHGNQFYCQRSCRQKAYLLRTGRQPELRWKRCWMCGKTFWVYHMNQRTCDERCRKDRRNFLVRAQRRRIQPVYHRNCTVCGIAFRSRVGHAKYCGDTCRKEATNAQSRLRYATQRMTTTPKRPPKTCIICGLAFTAQRNTAKYCGAQCKQTADKARRHTRQQKNPL